MSKDKTLSFKMDEALYTDFFAMAELDAKIHGFEFAGGAMVLRQLMREYIARVQSTAQSEVGRAAAKTLSKRVRS